MNQPVFLGIDCGSVSLNLVLLGESLNGPVSVYMRTQGRPMETFVKALRHMKDRLGQDLPIYGAMATGSARNLLSDSLGVAAINEITAHATGALSVNPQIRTIIEIGGQDSKFIVIEPPQTGVIPRIVSFRMNEICAAGTGAFLDEQAGRLGIPIESFGALAITSKNPAPIAGRCAVFAKTDMIHQAQEGVPIPDILLGVAFALARNYLGTLIRGDCLVPLVSLQGGVMANQAVVKAFRNLLALSQHEVIVPPHYRVLGALGCAEISRNHEGRTSFGELEKAAMSAPRRYSISSFSIPLDSSINRQIYPGAHRPEQIEKVPPLVMGLDVGSVSVKGVVINGQGRILVEDYRLSMGRPLDALDKVIASLSEDGLQADAFAVTGSGRSLVGKLLRADLVVNEISAQARAAIFYDQDVGAIVEIGGQDSKWISMESGAIKNFEMNRVCAAGTGSFLMEQADRIGLSMGQEFSDAAFLSRAPSDLGTRCTVFMESDLIHHQNNGATQADLSAGVCISVVRNYLEHVAKQMPLGNRVMFLGGVAANPAVRAAFEHETGVTFDSPPFFRISGAFGAALKALDSIKSGKIGSRKGALSLPKFREFVPERFTCGGCANNCSVDKYKFDDRIVFSGGRCQRWEAEDYTSRENNGTDAFTIRAQYLQEIAERLPERRSGIGLPSRAKNRLPAPVWGMIRSPQFYEWFPFWKSFIEDLGISLKVAAQPNREQFAHGTRFLHVETCLPMKVMAGQIRELVESGVEAIFHPTILNEAPAGFGGRNIEHCPYIQASSQFFRGSFDIRWHEPLISYEFDPDSFYNEHIRFALDIGVSENTARNAFEKAVDCQRLFNELMEKRGREFLDSLGEKDCALVVLGKPYHTAEPFLNMNLAGLLRSLGVKAIPADIFPLEDYPTRNSITWKHQLRMIGVARAISHDPRLFPVMITFFGCGPDPFTMRHIRESLKGKPLLVLEMDEHSSKAGVMTRLEAYLDSLSRYSIQDPQGESRMVSVQSVTESRGLDVIEASGKGDSVVFESSNLGEAGCSAQDSDRPTGRPRVIEHRQISKDRSHRGRADSIYIPYFGDHSHAFASAARSMGINASVLPPPDRESANLGRAYLMGGECHPYALILGDYLKIARQLPTSEAKRIIFCVPGYSACRLGQYAVYIEKVRKELGYPMRVIGDLSQAMTSFGVSKRNRDLVFLRTWEGLIAYDALLRFYLSLRAVAEAPSLLDQVYTDCKNFVSLSLSAGDGLSGIEAAVEELRRVKVNEHEIKPVIAITGDYYTRVVSFANNDVYREIERLGGTVWSPPTFSDGLKLFYLQEIMGRTWSSRSSEFDSRTSLYASMIVSEMRIKGLLFDKDAARPPIDPCGQRTKKAISNHMDYRYPPGITAPFATALSYLDQGAHGILNLITLNCSYGTVVTAALTRAMKCHPGVPMLTLVYDGLKKTNEKTRLEAFMEQVKGYSKL
ncbi:MAG: acyl-CoA dehydratase activase [Desulfomonilaceae bacterium]